MTDTAKIRRVSVEFLRPGQSHNQLLSPFTQYLAVCNDAGAAVVTVPYEQRIFERRIKELRYEAGDDADRPNVLYEIGRDVGRLLESVPGFTGALLNEGPASTLVHLRVTLSAAELALLPFELAQVPPGSAVAALSVQTRPPVTVTRHIRTVPDVAEWPTRPRVLFVSGDPDHVPFDAHRTALVDAVAPFQYPGQDDRKVSPDGRKETYGKLLTVLVNPTLVELKRECSREAYTHIHVLAHGSPTSLNELSYGLALIGENGDPDIVSGDRFVSAVTRLDHRPSVVTLATCDSSNGGSVVIPDGSFAHALHQAAIPLVVAAQFPLSKDGSVPLTALLYDGLLWGEHPLVSVRRVRAELHARFNSRWHDWASVVVYEALPSAFDDPLEQLRYAQARLAMNAALERVDNAVAAAGVTSDTLRGLELAVKDVAEKLPFGGQFECECRGVRASSLKRLAQAAFALSRHPDASVRQLRLGSQYDLLERARLDYASATKGLLVNDAGTLQRIATLHWVLVQLVSLSVVLGRDAAAGEWEAARLAAEHYLNHANPVERAWAEGSLAELYLLRLASRGTPDEERARAHDEMLKHAANLSRYFPGADEFPIKSTRRQFERYADWWSTPAFETELATCGISRPVPWIEAGVQGAAREVIALLTRSVPTAPDRRDDTSAPPAPAGPSPAPSATVHDPAPPVTVASVVAAHDGTMGRTRTSGAFFDVEALPAGHGDCLWIEYGNRSKRQRVLIDCGTQSTSKALLERVAGLPADDRVLELFVLSHIDSDHIGGALSFFRAVRDGLRIGDVWFNGWQQVSGQLGARQGEMFSTAIADFELPWNAWRNGHAIAVDGAGELPECVLPGGMKLTLLSPTRATLDELAPVWQRELKRYGLEPGGRVDYSRFLRGTPSTLADASMLRDIDALADTAFAGDKGRPNGTSIAVLAEFAGASALFAADAHAPVLVKSIEKLLRARGEQRLKLDLFKVSHHGSQNNVSSALIKLLDCPRYLISTNGDHFYHPDRQAIARILKYGGERKTICFNYNNRYNEVWGGDALADVRAAYGCTTVYPSADHPGITLSLIS